MARLGADYPFPTIDPGHDTDSWRAGFKAEQDALTKIMAEQTTIKFQRGDGYAMYVVASEKPLVLRWIPFGDKWQVDAPTIRGLRLDDVRALVERECALASIFGRSKTAKAGA